MKNKIIGLMFAVALAAGCGDGKKDKAKTCAELAGKAECEKADQIAGKACVFMAKSCVEKTAKLISFMEKLRVFENKKNGGVDIWGSGHTEQPNWDKLCYGDTGATANVWPITFRFQANSDRVNIDLGCALTSGPASAAQVYDLQYAATTLANGALLIKFDDGGRKVMHDQAQGTGAGEFNQLNFLTKASWFLTPAQDAIKGSSLLKYVGFYPAEPMVGFKTEKDIDDGIKFIKNALSTGAGNAGFDIEVNGKKANAITFIFNKAP